ncbi:type II secretion system protein GspL [Psychrobacter sp. S1-30-MNA-CIBAN-0213]|uniref:type II secretion system protein GspL n=1 Tax=unclassified Psychrobacter TaxID=196806 RepID=UPI003322D07F
MLHVWIRAQHSPLAVWHADAKEWQSVSGWQQLYDIYGNSRSSHTSLCLYFPSSHLLQVDTKLNAAQLKQLGSTGKQYLFEETSLAPVEQLAVRQISDTHAHHLYALAESDIEAWKQSAALVGLSINALLPDFLLLPIPEEGAGQQVVLYQDQYTALLRQSQRQGLAVSYLPLMFERLPHLSEVCLLRSIQSTVKTTVGSPADAFNDMVDNHVDLQKTVLEPATESTLDSNIATETAALLTEQQILLTPLSTVPMPIETPERHALNFFVKSSDTQLSPYLRIAMMVALSALVLQMATDGLQIYRYNIATDATQTAIAVQYQSWFPDEVLNTSRTKLQVQMQPKLRSDSQESASHLAVLARISPLIKQSSLHAQALVMEPTALSFTLIAPERGSLDQFASTLTGQGIAASLERVNSNEQGQFSGQITVNIENDPAAIDSSAQS